MVRKKLSPEKREELARKIRKGRRKPPEGYITSSEAEALLGNHMLYRYVDQHLIDKRVPEFSTYGFYKLEDVEKVRRSLQNIPQNGKDSVAPISTTFSRATVDDMEEVYDVAIELFPEGTTSADARKPLVAICPDGNYIVKDQGKVVSYVHLQPLKPATMKAFLKGEIRGKDITIQDIDTFEPGKSVDVLVKSIGSTRKNGEDKSAHYTQRLLLGTARELEKMGKRGVIIRKIYATSETISGIAMATDIKMRRIRTIKKPQGHSLGRYAYELDVATSDFPLLQSYKRALAEWKQSHGTQD